MVLVGVTLLATRRSRWEAGRSEVAALAALALALFAALTLAAAAWTCAVAPPATGRGVEPANAEQVLNLVLLPVGFFAESTSDDLPWDVIRTGRQGSQVEGRPGGSGELVEQAGVDVVQETADGDALGDERVRANHPDVVAQGPHLVLDHPEVLPGRVLASRLGHLGP